MELGTYADWASAIGSISASVVALYLAGSEKRAAKEAQRPQVLCDVDQRTGSASRVRISIYNPSPKPWRITSIEAIRPKGGGIISEALCYRRDSGGNAIGIDDHVLKLAGSRIDMSFDVDAAAVDKSNGNAGIILLYRRPPAHFGEMWLKVSLCSLEAIPDRFSEIVVRPMTPQAS